MILWISFIVTFGRVNLGQGEQPLSVCQNGRPFKTMDNSCSNFKEVCVKIGDPDCDNFQKACEQCPPSNYTVTILKDILKVQQKAEQNRNQIALEIKRDINKSSESNYIIVITVLIIAILSSLILVIEIRFKLITKLVNGKCAKKKVKSKRQNGLFEVGDMMDCFIKIEQHYSEQALLRNENQKDDLLPKNNDYIMKNEEITKTIKSLLEDFVLKNKENNLKNEETTKTIKSLLEKCDEAIKKSEQLTKNTKYLLDRKLNTKFRIKEKDKQTNFRVDINDNVLKVKRTVINKFTDYKPSDYKIMKLKYNDMIFDDNKNLLSYLDKPDVTIDCYFDTEINVNDIIILKVQSNQPVSELIQINKYKSVLVLKKTIFENLKDNEIKIFKDSKELDDQLTLTKYNLKDGDLINAIKKIQGDVVISSIFDERDKIAVYFSNWDSVSSLKTNFANKFNLNVENFVLFLHNQHLDENKLIFEYDIDTDSQLNFCSLMKLDDLIIKDQIGKGYYSVLLEAEIRSKKQKVVLKKYTQLGINTLKNNELLLNELNTFQIIKSHERFLQMYGIYKDDKFFYISMEHLNGISLKMYISKNGQLNENQIASWSKQILEGLKFLHDHNIIFRDLKTSNILLDGKEKIKLPSLTLSKYLHDYESNKLKETLKSDMIIPQRYLAPEIIKKESYGVKADIWSFGAILVEMVTGKEPYSELDEKNAANQILKNKTILFESEHVSKEITNFIKLCLVFDPKERASEKKLFKDKFLLNK